MIENNDIAYGGDEIEYDEHGDVIEYYAIRPNKTQIKYDIAETAKISEELTHLSSSQLVSMKLPEGLDKAIKEAKKMPATKPARKRQLKFITAQLRKFEIGLIMEVLDRLKTKNAHGVREHHQAESWRDELIASENNSTLTTLLNEFPNADRQQLSQLQRNAKKELKMDKPPKSSRLLYQYLKELISA